MLGGGKADDTQGMQGAGSDVEIQMENMKTALDIGKIGLAAATTTTTTDEVQELGYKYSCLWNTLF